MDKEPPDKADEPGAFSATGVDDPVDDSEYGDRPAHKFDIRRGQDLFDTVDAASAKQAVRRSDKTKPGFIYDVVCLDHSDYPDHRIRVSTDGDPEVIGSEYEHPAAKHDIEEGDVIVIEGPNGEDDIAVIVELCNPETLGFELGGRTMSSVQVSEVIAHVPKDNPEHENLSHAIQESAEDGALLSVSDFDYETWEPDKDVSVLTATIQIDHEDGREMLRDFFSDYDDVSVLDITDVANAPSGGGVEVEELPEVGDVVEYESHDSIIIGEVKSLNTVLDTTEIVVRQEEENWQETIQPDQIRSIVPKEDKETPDHGVFGDN